MLLVRVQNSGEYQTYGKNRIVSSDYYFIFYFLSLPTSFVLILISLLSGASLYHIYSTCDSPFTPLLHVRARDKRGNVFLSVPCLPLPACCCGHGSHCRHSFIALAVKAWLGRHIKAFSPHPNASVALSASTAFLPVICHLSCFVSCVII